MQEPPKTSNKTETRHGTGLAKATSVTLLVVGAAALIASVIYVSQILAFIGLSLMFWGALLLYIQPEEYAKKALLDATLTPSLQALNQIMEELGYRGKAVYLPPKYFEDPEASKTYIPKNRDEVLPDPQLVLKQGNQIFFNNPNGILLTPPGAELTKIFERRLGTTFTTVDLQYVQEKLPNLLIEDLEIAEDLEIEIEYGKEAEKTIDSASPIQTRNDTIHVKITNSILQEAWKENSTLSHVHSRIGCPICSAIACTLAKATGKPVTIEKIQPSPDGKTIEATYQVLETEPQKQAEKASAQTSQTIKSVPSRLPKVTSLFLISFGSIILAWIGWLTWYDLTTFGKDLALIFFGSRANEAISLGIDMKVIYYLLIGLTLLLTGIVIHLRRRKSSTSDQPKRPLT